MPGTGSPFSRSDADLADGVSPLALVAILVGNSRVRVAAVRGTEVAQAWSVDVHAPDAPAQTLGRAREALALLDGPTFVLASVNAPRAEAIESAIVAAGHEVYRFGRDLEIPIARALDDDSTVGHDRLLAALGAFARFRQACVVIDAGTAITVDFVDGEGTFQGGAIAPGVTLGLRALHQQTAALPEIVYAKPDAARGPFGKDTRHAMVLGVHAAAVGLAHHLIDTYAEAYGGYPRVIATGGDAPALFEHDALVEVVDPELVIRGMAHACLLLLGQVHDPSDDLNDDDAGPDDRRDED
ncbi:MAG: type III pantothenate kinase [Planctomycetota bacterium]|nr:type III pantothenate kinase [Planctomycetota bacterium]